MSIFIQAIKNLSPNSSWMCVGDELYENIDWQDEVNLKPSKKNIEAEVARLQAIEDALVQAEVDKKQAAEAKLAKLGLTPEDLKTLLG
jgi:hypothetical protein